MKEMWRSDSCYANYGVDGSACSFFIYLSEVSTRVCVRIYLKLVMVCGSHVYLCPTKKLLDKTMEENSAYRIILQFLVFVLNKTFTNIVKPVNKKV